ncbi:MAG: thioredoxin fold domain-containing protein [Pseudomonadota bacterium]
MRRLLALLLALAACAAGATEPWERFFSPSLGDLRAEAQEARKAGKQALLLMYGFEECPSCARMKREVLSRPEVQDFYVERFRVIEIDTLGAQEVTGFDGRAQPEKAFARAAGIRGTPTFVFHDFDGKVLATHVGGVFDAREFMRLGERVLERKAKP